MTVAYNSIILTTMYRQEHYSKVDEDMYTLLFRIPVEARLWMRNFFAAQRSNWWIVLFFIGLLSL